MNRARRLSLFAVFAGAAFLGLWAGVRIVVLASYPEMLQGLRLLTPLFQGGGILFGAYQLLGSKAARRAAGAYARHRNRKMPQGPPQGPPRQGSPRQGSPHPDTPHHP